MEADLDLADKLKATDQELSGDDLMFAKYASEKTTTNPKKSYNNTLYAPSTNDFKSKTTIDPVLHRATTPGQLRQSIVSHTVDSLANSLAAGDIFHSQNSGLDQLNSNSLAFTASMSVSMKKPLSASVTSTASNNNKISKPSSSTTKPKATNRTSSTDQQKQITPVLAFGDTNDQLDCSIATITTPKKTPPVKFSFCEPPRSNSSASMRSSSSSIHDLSNGNLSNQKTKKS